MAPAASCAGPTRQACRPSPRTTETLSAGVESSSAWTLMFYMAVDNSAEAELGWFRDYTQRFCPGEELEAIMLVDRSKGHSRDKKVFGENFTDTRLYRFGTRGFERLAGGRQFPEIDPASTYEANTADPDTLRKFIRFGKENYPADHYALVLLGHADGQILMPDEDPVASTTPHAIRAALTPEDSVDLVVLDLCSMGSIETAYEWRPGNGGFSAEKMVAIASAGKALPWDLILPRLAPPPARRQEYTGVVEDLSALTPEQFGRLLVDRTAAERRWSYDNKPSKRRKQILGYESCTLMDLRKSAEVKAASDRLASMLHRHDAKEALEAVRGPGPSPHAMQYTFNIEERWPSMPYFDLANLAEMIAQSDAFHAEVRAAARDLVRAATGLVVHSFGMHSLHGFEAGKHGVSITFPDGDARLPTASGAADRRAWWALSRSENDVEVGYGLWSFSLDNATRNNGVVETWFELMDAWYDEPAAESGGHNRYEW